VIWKLWLSYVRQHSKIIFCTMKQSIKLDLSFSRPCDRSISCEIRCGVYWWLFTDISEHLAAPIFKVIQKEWFGIYPEYWGRSFSDSLATNYQLTKRYISKQCKLQNPILGALTKFRKGTISFIVSLCLSLCLSVCPSAREKTLLPMDGFSWNLIFEYFSKKIEKFQVSLKYDQKNG
jgi:hypothetical protein